MAGMGGRGMQIGMMTRLVAWTMKNN